MRVPLAHILQLVRHLVLIVLQVHTRLQQVLHLARRAL
jgi:hypothetical protein